MSALYWLVLFLVGFWFLGLFRRGIDIGRFSHQRHESCIDSDAPFGLRWELHYGISDRALSGGLLMLRDAL